MRIKCHECGKSGVLKYLNKYLHKPIYNIKQESLSTESYKEKVLKYKIVDHLNNEYDLHFDTDRAKIIRLSGNQAKKFFDVTNTASLEIGMSDEFEKWENDGN